MHVRLHGIEHFRLKKHVSEMQTVEGILLHGPGKAFLEKRRPRFEDYPKFP